MPLAQDRADVVVIGGGVIGCACAYELASAGLSVIVLEGGELGGGSTSKAAGGTRASFSDPANIAMGARGLEVFATFKERFGQDIDFRRNGYLFSICDDASLASFQQSVQLQQSLGIDSRFIDPEQAQRISPMLSTEGALAHVWAPQDAQCTPDAVTQGYARAARAAGARLQTGTPVLGIDSSGGRVTAVRTATTSYSTSWVVCAAGAWSAQVGAMVGIDLPINPSRRVMAFTGPIFDTPQPWPLTADFPTALYFHPEGRGLAIGWTDPEEPDGFDVSVGLGSWLERVGPTIAERAPALLELPITSAWAGLYENTPDHNQIIGVSRNVTGFVYATGYSGHGFQMAPATSEIVRDLITGEEPRYDISGFDVERFALAGARREHNII